MSAFKVTLVAMALSVVSVLPATAQIVVYSNDFEGSGAVGFEWSVWDGNEWGPPPTDTTPGTPQHPADKFLGQFGKDATTDDYHHAKLTLNDLPLDHTEITLTFDLYIIRSWDGNSTTHGEDWWAIDADVYPEGEWDFVTTFSNWDGVNQAFPWAWPDGDFPAHEGSSEVNTLGYQFQQAPDDWIDQDAVYSIPWTFDHTGSSLEITFGADNLQAITDESWGLDNVVVEVDIPEPTTVLFLCLGSLTALRRVRRGANTRT